MMNCDILKIQNTLINDNTFLIVREVNRSTNKSLKLRKMGLDKITLTTIKQQAIVAAMVLN
jgi:hypothetical protein